MMSAARLRYGQGQCESRGREASALPFFSLRSSPLMDRAEGEAKGADRLSYSSAWVCPRRY